MLKIAIVGLGLIGGSMAWALQRTEKYIVDGWNRSEKPLSFALENGIIGKKAEDLTEYDVVFIALPPVNTLEYLDGATFRDNAIVADICGVKEIVEKHVYSKPRNYRYVGCHPMAGKEVSSIFHATPDLFQKASMIITRAQHTDEAAVNVIRRLSADMGFCRIVECDAVYHDQKIAYTSQLAHIVSNGYVKSNTIEGWSGYTGGSFQDMTRIARVDETVWTQLYMRNRSALLAEVETLIGNLTQYRDALQNNDEAMLFALLKEGRLIAEKQFDNKDGK